MSLAVTHLRLGSCEMLRRIGYERQFGRQVHIQSTSTFPIRARPKDLTGGFVAGFPNDWPEVDKTIGKSPREHRISGLEVLLTANPNPTPNVSVA